jgi:hypothetical protein
MSRVISYVVDRDRAETIYLTAVTSNATNDGKLNILYPHEVKFKVMGVYGTPLENVNVTAVMVETTTQGTNWLESLFGISSVATSVTSTTMQGSTSTDGSIVFPMVSSLKYSMVFTSVAQGISKTITLYPDQAIYNIVLASTLVAPTYIQGDYIHAALTAGDGSGALVNLNLTYNDSLLSTTSVTFYVNDGNGTQLYVSTGAPAGGIFDRSYAVTNRKTKNYVWGYNATSTQFGLISEAMGITMKGTGSMYVDIAPCVNSRGVPYATGWGNEC